MFVFVGLGNPGDEYAHSRHNTGRMILEGIAKRNAISISPIGKHTAHVGKGKIGKENALFLFPDTYMNKSGSSVKTAVLTLQQAESLVVVYDDLDLPWGTIRIAFGRGSGGHNGVESIIKSIKTKDFIRVRVGVAPSTPSGKLRKPKGEDAVIKFLMSNFGKKEMEDYRAIEKGVEQALTLIVDEGYQVAMNTCN